MLLAVSKACLGPCLPPQLATPWAGILLSALSLFESYRLKVFPQPSVRELFVPILWLPRRCVFDGFLQEFEGFKGYVRPLSGRLSLAGWAGILLGLCRFACVPTSGTSMLLAVSKACLGTSSAATLATPWAGTLLGLCRFACVPTTCTSMLFSGFEGAVWAPVCRLESMGLCRFACVPTTGTSMLLAVSKVLFGQLVCSHIGHPVGWNPAGALPFRMRAHHRCLHAFSGFEGVFGHLSAATIGHPLGWNPAFCAFAFRVLPFESVSSRPYGSFSCRFCGFQEGAFSMASYRSLRGSKGTLGLCGAVCLWRVGLESCWGSAVSHACPPPVPPCF